GSRAAPGWASSCGAGGVRGPRGTAAPRPADPGGRDGRPRRGRAPSGSRPSHGEAACPCRLAVHAARGSGVDHPPPVCVVDVLSGSPVRLLSGFWLPFAVTCRSGRSAAAAARCFDVLIRAKMRVHPQVTTKLHEIRKITLSITAVLK
ncbi:hypothetical protein THAOC_19349, partial [Thalassiosira oceanica]